LADKKRLVTTRTRHSAGPEDPNETGSSIDEVMLDGSFDVIDHSAGE
jgi:hypothetical protein